MKKISKPNGNKVALRIVQKFHPGVKEVVDAKDHIVVTVTSNHNKISSVKNHRQCALAVACQKQQHADGAIISMKSAYVIKGEVAYRYQVPTSTSREVVTFDRAGSGGFAPGKYQLRAPSESNQLGHWFAGPGKKAGKPHGKRVRHVTQNVRTSLLSKAA